MADIPAIKAANDTAVTNKVAVNSITPADEGGRLNAITDELRPYKVYSFFISQTGTDDPVATVLENTIGPIVWEHSGQPGDYDGRLLDAFPEGKTFCFPMLQHESVDQSGVMRRTIKFVWETTESVAIYTTEAEDTDPPVGTDGILGLDPPGRVPLEIRVYP